MSNTSARTRTREDGFTLIELLVVVLIIGILASIALPAFLAQKEKARDSAAKSLIRSGVVAAESYYADRQTFNGLAPNLLSEQELNVEWLMSTSVDLIPDTPDDQIRVDVYGTPPNEDSYVMYTRSATGTVFSYLRTPLGTTYRCSGTGSPDPATADLTLGCVAPYGGGW